MEKWKKQLKDFQKGVKDGITNIKGSMIRFYDMEVGNKAFKKGDYNKARDQYLKLLETAEMNGNLSQKAHALHDLGGTCLQVSNYDEAIKYFQQSLQGFEELGELHDRALALNSIGLCYQNLNNYEEAIKCYQQSLHGFEELGELNSRARPIFHFGEIHDSRGEYDEALKYYCEALDISKQTKDKSFQSWVLNKTGCLERQKHKLSKALEKHLEALNIAKKIKANHFIAKFLSEVGKDYMELGQKDQAINFIKESKAKYRAVLEKTPVDQRRELESEFEHLYDELDILLDKSENPEMQEWLNSFKNEIGEILLDNKKGIGEDLEKISIRIELDMFIERPDELTGYIIKIIKSDWSDVKKDKWAGAVQEILENWKQFKPKKWQKCANIILKIVLGKFGGEDLSGYITLGIQKLFDWVKSNK